MRLVILLVLLLLCACPQTNTCTSNQDCGGVLSTCDTACGTCIDPCATNDQCTQPGEVCGPSACGTGQAACQLPGTGGSGGTGGDAGAGGGAGEGGVGGVAGAGGTGGTAGAHPP